MAAIFSSHHAALCPPPLHIRKKTRRATFRRHLLRTTSRAPRTNDTLYSPLDDIIDEIAGGIWEAPFNLDFEPLHLDWIEPLEASSTWSATPLPVSRIPSDQPLSVRKNRNSRSATSGSSMSEPTTSLHNDNDEGVSLETWVLEPWPLLDSDPRHSDDDGPASSTDTVYTQDSAARQALADTLQNNENGAQSFGQRFSRFRRLTNTLSLRLRRSTTGSTIRTDASLQPDLSVALEETETNDSFSLNYEVPTHDAVSAFVLRNAHSPAAIEPMMGSIAKQLPPPSDLRRASFAANDMPTVLKAAVKIIPETKVLTKDARQDLWVAVEVEGIPHNSHSMQDRNIDVVFVVDNGYYVTEDCLNRAVDVAHGALHYLDQGDRAALYTTHCTHEAISGTVPDIHFPLRVFDSKNRQIIHDLACDIRKLGTQTWDPPRPNPSFAEVVLAIARNLEGDEPKRNRTHIIVLSPRTSPLHKVSKSYPDMLVHQVNPALLPFPDGQELCKISCTESCCGNIPYNYTHYQSAPGCIKQILQYARLEKPLGQLTDVNIDLRTRTGCEILEIKGSTRIPSLRLGQVHSFMVRLSIVPSQTEEINLNSINSKDPILSCALNANNRRHELYIAKMNKATKPHILSVQVLYHDSLHAPDEWIFTEAPLLMFKKLGTLAGPVNTTVDMYKRRFLLDISQLRPDAAMDLAKILESELDVEKQEEGLEYLRRLKREVAHHQRIVEYEQKSRPQGSNHPEDEHSAQSHRPMILLRVFERKNVIPKPLRRIQKCSEGNRRELKEVTHIQVDDLYGLEKSMRTQMKQHESTYRLLSTLGALFRKRNLFLALFTLCLAFQFVPVGKGVQRRHPSGLGLDFASNPGLFQLRVTLKSLANTMAQLRYLEFDRIGMLTLEDAGLCKPTIGLHYSWDEFGSVNLREYWSRLACTTARDYYTAGIDKWFHLSDSGRAKGLQFMLRCIFNSAPFVSSKEHSKDEKETFVLLRLHSLV